MYRELWSLLSEFCEFTIFSNSVASDEKDWNHINYKQQDAAACVKRSIKKQDQVELCLYK